MTARVLAGGLLGLISLSLAGTSQAAISYENCQQHWSQASTPRRVVALNQSAADTLLALQAGDMLVGVSYLDDAPQAQKQGIYHGIPVLSREYPAAEVLLAKKVDFVVASYRSAFQSGSGDRQQLERRGIGSYLLHDGCSRNAGSSLQDVITDIQTLGKLLGRETAASQLVARIAQRVQQVRELPALSRPPRVFYYDGGQQDIYTQGGGGFISVLLAQAGGQNIFADRRQKWLHASAEMLISQQPDIILLSDDIRLPAARKIAFMRADPVLSTLTAVQENRFISLSFSELYPGVHSGETLWKLARQMRALMAR